MATKLGSAFVDVEADFSKFDRQVAAKLAASAAFKDAGDRSGRDFGKGFTSGVSTPVRAALRDVSKDVAGATAGVKSMDKALKDAGATAKKVSASLGDVDGSPLAAVTAGISEFAALDKTGRLNLEISGANAKLKGLSADIDALTAQPRTAEIDADISDAIKAFNRVEKARDKLIAERAAIIPIKLDGDLEARLAAADTAIGVLQAHVADLTGRPQTLEIQAETTLARVELERLEQEKRRLSATKATITADVDTSAASKLSSIAASAKGLATALGAGGGGLGDATTRVSFGFLSFGASLTPLVGLIAAAAVAIGVSLVGALAALAASLALAAAGVAALGAAFGGILGASLALVIPVAVRMAKVFESLKADSAASDAAARGNAAGSAVAAAAAKQQESAARGLTDANRSLAEASRAVGVAAKAAYREMADAAETASDAIRNVETSQLSLDRAKISTERARLELAQFRNELGATGEAFGEAFRKFTDVSVDTSGLRKAISDANAQSGGSLTEGQELDLRDKILAVREARQREKDAVDGVSDATRTASRAQEIDNGFKRVGIAYSQQYQGALKAQAAAQRGVANAQRAVADANEAAAGGAAIAAQEKATQLAGRLTKAEIKLKETLQDVGKALRGAFSPATDAVVSGMTTALGRLPAIVNPVRGAFTRLGEAWRDSLRAFSGDLIRPDSISKMRAFTDGAAKLAGPVTRGISALLDILTDIGRAALPFLISGTEKVADKLEEWSKGTGNAKALDKVIGKLVSHTKTWLGVTAAIADVFLAFFVAAAPSGQALADRIKEIANGMAEWLRSDAGRERLKQFFADTLPLAKQVVKGIGEMTLGLIRFGAFAAPILAAVFSGFGKIVGAVKDVVRWFGEHKTVSTILLTVLGSVAAALAVVGVAAGVTAAAAGLLSGVLTVLTAVVFANPFVLAAAAIIGVAVALKVAYERSETFRKIVGAAVDFVKNHWEELLVVLGGPIGAVVLVIIKKFDSIKAAASAVITFIRNNWKVIGAILSAPFAAGVVLITKSFGTIKTVVREVLQFIIGMFDKVAGGFSTMLTALSKVPGFGWAKTAAQDIDGIRAGLRKVSSALDDLPAKKGVRLHLTLTPESKKALEALNKLGNSVGGPQGTGRIGRASGGIIPGTGIADNVPLWGTPGEFMTRRAIVQRIGPTVFADINAGRLDPRVGYEVGQRPSVSTQPVKGNHFATGGLVAAQAAVAERPNINITTPITVPGGGQPDPVALGAAQIRIVETHFGGFPRQR